MNLPYGYIFHSGLQQPFQFSSQKATQKIIYKLLSQWADTPVEGGKNTAQTSSDQVPFLRASFIDTKRSEHLVSATFPAFSKLVRERTNPFP